MCSICMLIIISSYRYIFERINAAESEEIYVSPGDSGDIVMSVQERLKEIGLYDGECNGSYNVATADAVRRFQLYNSLEANGMCDDSTLALLIGDKSGIQEKEERQYRNRLARIIHSEAGDSPYLVQVAVGSVILNRLENDRFPDTLSGVIHSYEAFDSVGKLSYLLPPDPQSYRAARDAIAGLSPVEGAYYYYREEDGAPDNVNEFKEICTLYGYVFLGLK